MIINLEERIKEIGKSFTEVSSQINCFKKGVDKMKLLKPALISDGVLNIDKYRYSALFNSVEQQKKMVAFIPASGAATRMFKQLYLFLETEKENDTVIEFCKNINKFPFADDIPDKKKLHKKELIKFLLGKKGLNLGDTPKGLVLFHSGEKNKTAFEEQLNTASVYVNELHFTVSERHLEKFKEVLAHVNIDKQISFSFQKSSTDTIAVDIENIPFEENGKLIFRPGGHGALIENLNDIEADVIFVKNIDNVAIEKIEESNFVYKKALAGKLFELQNRIHNSLCSLIDSEVREVDLKEIASFATLELNIIIPASISDLRAFLIRKLNRPIRVCGMVKNEGQPGGGPFWVESKSGEVSLQIVEGAQIDKNDLEQLKIMNQATHFNPVDIVCGVKNYKGEKFNLLQFVNHETAFITQKSRNGKLIKALERPGLWNGAMADWITVFVEVPLHTFNPVKTINDLLKPNHQNG